MLLSIIIVNWNTRDYVSACLASIEQARVLAHRGNVETIVVDNCSSDDSAAIIRNSFPWVKLIENAENVGFAAANNLGIRQSTGRFVLLLNPDTEVRDGALDDLVAFLEHNSEAGAVGARLLNSDGTLQQSCSAQPTLNSELLRLFHLESLAPQRQYHMHDWPTTEPRQVGVLLGACLMTRREVLNEVGLLDERYFMYTEEVDWCFRVTESGRQIWWLPQAVVVHHGGQSTRQNQQTMFLELYRSKLDFFRKNYGRLSGAAYKALLFGTAVSRIVGAPVAAALNPNKRAEYGQTSANYWRLIRQLPTL